MGVTSFERVVVPRDGNEPERICWTEDDFIDIFSSQDINQKQYGYKLEEAGLVEQIKRKYEGKRSIKFYLRKGWEIRVVNGKGSWLQNLTDIQEQRSLKEDEGYRDAMSLEF